VSRIERVGGRLFNHAAGRTSMAVNTAKVEGRRKLDYASYDELLADADRMKSGAVKVLGNWSPGQIFRHLATAYNSSIDGFEFVFPWYMRLMVKPFKNRLLRGSMPTGFKIPADGTKSLVPAPATTEAGLSELHAAVGRLKRETRRASNPLFGNLSNAEWDQLHLKHASMHMGFLIPTSADTGVKAS
jgi:hypothetical protein